LSDPETAKLHVYSPDVVAPASTPIAATALLLLLLMVLL